jgi:hypothetical protein
MNSISGFLQKFLNLEKDKNTKISIILETIKQTVGVDLPKEAVDIRGDSLRLNCNPVFRNEIFMHKNKIESSLKSQKIFLNLV